MSYYRHCLSWGVALIMLPLFVGCGASNGRAPIGLNTGLHGLGECERWVPARPDADRAMSFELAGELGASAVRDRLMNWGTMQPDRERPIDFGAADDYVRRAQAAHQDVLVVFQGIPRWAAAGPGALPVDTGLPDRGQAEAFSSFVRAFVERYDADGLGDMSRLTGAVGLYEFMPGSERLDANEYAWWLVRFREAVRRADRHAKVVLGALSCPGAKPYDQPDEQAPAFLERLLASPELAGLGFPHFDILAFSNYPAQYPGRTPFDDQYAWMRKVMAAHQLERPIWLVECGVLASPGAEARQADDLVKYAVRARALGIERLYVQGLWDCRPPPGTRGATLGLVADAPAGKPTAYRPAFTAVSKMIRELKDRPEVAYRSAGLYVLTGKNPVKYVIWQEEGLRAGHALLQGWWDVEPLDGLPVARLGKDIKLSPSPLFMSRVTSPFIE